MGKPKPQNEAKMIPDQVFVFKACIENTGIRDRLLKELDYEKEISTDHCKN